MSISLKKGQKVSLSKEGKGLTKVIVGLGWDEAKQKRGLFAKKPQSIDCDAIAYMLVDGKLINRKDTVYFGNLTHSSGTVVHEGDNLTGAGKGDDEHIVIDLANVPPQYDRIMIGVNIYQAFSRNQHFGMIQNAFIRIVDASTGIEMCKFSLTDDYSGMTAMIFGEVYRNGNEWKFNAIGQGYHDGSVESLGDHFK